MSSKSDSESENVGPEIPQKEDSGVTDNVVVEQPESEVSDEKEPSATLESAVEKIAEAVVPDLVEKIEEKNDNPGENNVKAKTVDNFKKADVEDGECAPDSPSQQVLSEEEVVPEKIEIKSVKTPAQKEAIDDDKKSDPEDGECVPETESQPKLRSVVEKRVDATSAEKKDNKSTVTKDSERDSYSSRGRKQDTRRREEDRRRRDRSRSYSRSRSRDRRRRNDEPRSRDQRPADTTTTTEKPDPSVITRRQQRTVDLLTSKTGGAYIPPAKLRLLQAEITDKSSAAYQRIAWEALKKSIHGYINKVNVDNIGIITRELLKENIVRGRGLICRSIIQAQAASPTFTHVYAALVSVINSKFPNIGELLLKRLVIQFKRGFRRNDKMVCLSASRFIAHLVNQRVAHEILALEILTLLVETPTDDSVEVAIAFLKESGMKLQEVSSKGVNAIFEMLKNILHEGRLDKRVQYMIEVVFQVRKDGFKDHVAVQEALELVEEDDQFTHLIMLEEATEAQDVLSKYSLFGCHILVIKISL